MQVTHITCQTPLFMNVKQDDKGLTTPITASVDHLHEFEIKLWVRLEYAGVPHAVDVS